MIVYKIGIRCVSYHSRRLWGKKMIDKILVGCSGFQKSHAEYYRKFSLVEIQQTFYKLPMLKTAARWKQEAPAGFVFTIKAWQVITHEPWSPTYRHTDLSIPRKEWEDYGSFRASLVVQKAWEATRDFAQELGAKIVLFQCPRQFTPSKEHVDAFRRFFERINRGKLYLAWEPRGKWPDELVATLCAEFDLLHAVDPFLNESQYGETGYFRLHGGPDYTYSYTDEDLDRLKNICERKSEVYCLFNNVSMWNDGSRFQMRIGRNQD